MFKYFNDDNLAYQNGTSATISMGNWFVLMLISLLSIIPFIGFIVVVASYLVLAFRKETAPSIANFIKMQLIMSLIALVIGIIMIVVFMGSLGAIGAMLG